MPWGAVIGAVAPSLINGIFGSGPSGQTTQTGSSSPWIGQQPYLTQGFQNAQNWYNNGGTQVAPMNQMQNQSFNMAQNNATNNQALNSSNNAISQFASGNMMNNPYLGQMANAADNSITRNYQSAVAPGIQSNAEANGRFGSGSMQNQSNQAQQNLATQLGNTNAGIYGGAYQSGLNNMLQASSLAPSNNQANLSNIGAVNAAGNQQQAYQQQVNNQPLTNMQSYQGLIGGNMGSQTSQSTPYYQNTAGNILGGALAGNQLYNQFNNSQQANANQGALNFTNGWNSSNYG